MKKNLLLKIIWLLPLLVGLLDFLCWFITRNSIFVTIGFITVFSGILLAMIGLSIGLIKIVRNNKEDKKSENRKILRLMLLIFSNFPICFLILYISLQVITGFTIKIYNETNKTLQNCVIEGGGIRQELSFIEPSKSKETTVWFKTDGILYLSYEINFIEHKIPVHGYVTSGLGGQREFVVSE